MIEPIILVAALAAFPETAKRRGVSASPFILVAGLDWIVPSTWRATHHRARS